MDSEELLETLLKSHVQDLHHDKLYAGHIDGVNKYNEFISCLKASGFPFSTRRSWAHPVGSRLIFRNADKTAEVPFFGSPFQIVKTTKMQCVHGDHYYKKWPSKVTLSSKPVTESAEERLTAKKRIRFRLPLMECERTTKKIGCPAHLSVKCIRVFPTYSISESDYKNSRRVNKVIVRLKSELSENPTLTSIVRYMIVISPASDHCHPLKLERPCPHFLSDPSHPDDLSQGNDLLQSAALYAGIGQDEPYKPTSDNVASKHDETRQMLQNLGNLTYQMSDEAIGALHETVCDLLRAAESNVRRSEEGGNESVVVAQRVDNNEGTTEEVDGREGIGVQERNESVVMLQRFDNNEGTTEEVDGREGIGVQERNESVVMLERFDNNEGGVVREGTVRFGKTITTQPRIKIIKIYSDLRQVPQDMDYASGIAEVGATADDGMSTNRWDIEDAGINMIIM